MHRRVLIVLALAALSGCAAESASGPAAFSGNVTVEGMPLPVRGVVSADGRDLDVRTSLGAELPIELRVRGDTAYVKVPPRGRLTTPGGKPWGAADVRRVPLLQALVSQARALDRSGGGTLAAAPPAGQTFDATAMLEDIGPAIARAP